MNRSFPFLRVGLAGCLICLSVMVRPSPAETADSQECSRIVFYVSTKGSDKWSGRLPAPAANQQDGPLATLTAARNAIRRLKATNNLPGAVEVMVLDGTYYLTEPFVLAAEDSGTEKQPLAYSAYPGHHPVLSGGRVINDWKPFQGKIMETRLPDVKEGRWKFRQLFFRGQRQTRARWPNPDPADRLYSGWAFAECDHNVYFLVANQEPQIRGVGSLSDWKKLGFDQHSLVVDPQFVDAENGDYRLRPESPAFSLGFQPIPVDKIGPRWKAVPHDAR